MSSELLQLESLNSLPCSLTWLSNPVARPSFLVASLGWYLLLILELPAVLEASEMTKVALSWLQKGSKLFIFGMLGIGVLPLLIGLLFEHLLLPIR